FALSVVTTVATIYGVSRFVRNGFDFLAGNFSQHSGFYFPPYLLLALSIVTSIVVIGHLVSWRWMVSGRSKDTV
ncbi:MAG: hypothetical protein MUO51_06875, partial [Woeseiaceae bacterium]|nr:hypothetical protein [Woeseiaceae bacterium]